MTSAQTRPSAISDLREQPGFCSTVADRVWRAWWQGAGHPFEQVSDHMQEMLDDRPLPLGLVAHYGKQYLGSTLIVSCDLEERPQYAPWVAAVWVDPEHRRRGIGRALVGRAAEAAFGLGYDIAYLCALPEKRSFYEAFGWNRLEEGVGPHGLAVLIQERCKIAPDPLQT
ncbi:putative N-acetyltransferase YhbS [Sinorhizobium kostiense]|uniref:N-acetyltransferase YhbS n=1 Tax=Sinorhizobium kostiense TaxID=76747 RepID=A0ABS4R3W9_9HYPH|nr:GNAT family N-acetyltransferase [Sinorhizobium kostiense]MBP2237101.1 putative N-acetyltransferase YhbS [Sinorhizobium kostiense]